MKAAGRTLTVGELRKTLTGLRDDDPVTIRDDADDPLPAVAVEPTPGGGVTVVVSGERAQPDEELLAFVRDLAGGAYKLAEAKREARSICGTWGA